MTPEQREAVNSGLIKFGASLTEDNLIQKGNRVIPGVLVLVKGRRLRFQNRMTGDLIASGPVSEAFAKSFVKKFWYWEEVKENK